MCVCMCRAKRLLLSVCVGGKISMCSLPLHTAEQIGEVVRSHNMRGQPGDEKSCRQDGAELMAEYEEGLAHDGM